MTDKSILVISDLHIPYHHPDSFKFLAAVKKQFNPTRVICVGDEIDCFPPSAEVLTDSGWVRFDNLDESMKVAQWEEGGNISFVVPEAYVVKPYKGSLLRIEHTSYLSMTTPRHNIVKLHPQTGRAHRREAWDMAGTNSWEIPRYGVCGGSGISLTDNEIKLWMAFQADGTIDRNAIKFEFQKERKIGRLSTLLSDMGISYTTRITSRGTTVIRLNKPDYVSKTFPKTWVSDMSLRQKDLFLSELVHWDGTEVATIGVKYTSVVQDNLDVVQAIAHTSGKHTKMAYPSITVHANRVERTSQKSCEVSEIPYEGTVYCVQVPSGMIVVRQEGHVTVTGNCHAISFHDSDPDLKSAGDELRESIKQLKILYKLFPDVDVLHSNHGSLGFRKALHHGIPKAFLKELKEVLEAPKGWNWHDDLLINLPGGNQCYFHHGLIKDPIKAVALRGVCVVQGHFHEKSGIDYVSNPNSLLWGMTVGCLINKNSMAFAYNKINLKRPILSVGLIVNGHPLLIPMVLNKNGKWVGTL